MITVYAFGNVVAPVRGITRDLRALWALEESGLPYRVHTLDDIRGELGTPEYARVSPFGLIPAIDDDGFKVFESGVIVFYISDKAGKLLPKDIKGRALAMQWAFAALNTMEPDAVTIAAIDKFFADQAWARERRPALSRSLEARLAVLGRALTDRPYLLGDEFTVPDILMISVLRFIQHTDLPGAVQNVAAYKSRCEDRPAWKKTFAAYEQRLAGRTM